MGNRRKRLTEQTLRDTKDDLIRRVADQKRRGGVRGERGLESDPTGGVREAEEWLDPILRKVEKTHEEDRDADLVRVDEEALAPQPKFADTREDIGTYEWNLRTNKIVAAPGSYEAKEQARSDVAKFCHVLWGIPEWKGPLKQAALICPTHLRPTPFCTPCERREDALRRLVALALQAYREKKKKQ